MGINIYIYMNNFVYKIEFNKTSLELNDHYQKLTDIEKEKISDLNAKSYFDYDDNGYIIYMIISPIELNKYLDILNDNFIKYEVTNISNRILKGKYDINLLKTNLNSYSIIKWEFFKEDLNEWIMGNLDIDIILDRISEVGIENLTDVEKKFLKNYK